MATRLETADGGGVNEQEARSNTMDFSISIGLAIMSLLSYLTAVLGNFDDRERYPCLCLAAPSMAFRR